MSTWKLNWEVSTLTEVLVNPNWQRPPWELKCPNSICMCLLCRDFFIFFLFIFFVLCFLLLPSPHDIREAINYWELEEDQWLDRMAWQLEIGKYWSTENLIHIYIHTAPTWLLQLMKAAVPAESYVIHLSSASLFSCDVYGQ